MCARTEPVAGSAAGSASHARGVEGRLATEPRKPDGSTTPKLKQTQQGVNEPQEALQQSQKLLQLAKQAASNGNHKKAFADALEAWKLVREHPNHSACQQQSRELMELMKREGELIDMAVPSAKRLVVQ